WNPTRSLYLLALVNQIILLEQPFDDIDEFLRRSVHLTTIRPDSPPEGKPTIDLVRRCIGQDRHMGTILRDQVSRSTGASKDHNCSHTRFFAQCACRMTYRMRLCAPLVLWLACSPTLCLGLQGNAHHHLDG